MSSNRRYEIFTRRSEVANLTEFGEAQLGGVTLYGESARILSEAIASLESALEGVVRRVPSADRHSMLAMLRKEAGQGVHRRVLGAVIGSVLRKGRIAVLPGETEAGEMVTIVCTPEMRAAFDRRVEQLERSLRAEGEMLIRSLRDAFFPGEGSGAWTWTWHLAARAVYLGRACFVDRYRISWPGDFCDVVGTPR